MTTQTVTPNTTTPPMNPAIKTLWLEALRSGEFKQAEKALKTENGHCCLGVLCEVHKRVTGEGAWTPEGSYGINDDESESQVLPPTVAAWAGMLGMFAYNPCALGTNTSLAELNDAGATFLEIADLIEKGL